MTDTVQHHDDRRQTAVDIAVLKEQVNTLGREMGELKKVNKEQSDKLDLMLRQMEQARGGLRVTLWFGGAMATFGGAIAWAVEHMFGRAHP